MSDGTVLAVCVSSKKGEQKRSVERVVARLREEDRNESQQEGGKGHQERTASAGSVGLPAAAGESGVRT